MKLELPVDLASSNDNDIIGEGLFRFLEDIDKSSEKSNEEEEEERNLRRLYGNIEHKSDVKAARSHCTYKYSFESTAQVLEKEKNDMVAGEQKKNFNKRHGIPPLQESQSSFNSEESLAAWLMEEHPGALKVPEECPCCGHKLKVNRTTVRCCHCARHSEKEFKQSVWRNSFFQGLQKNKCTVMMFLHCWISGATTKQLGLFTGWSKTTVNKVLVKAQELITEIVVFDHHLVGGPGMAVEIDESKFGKRKHNRGHRVEGCWVFGGVEVTPERRCFAVVAPDRSRETLIPIIASHIAPGSIIRSDFWKAHDIIPFLPGHDYIHEKVNHSLEFVSEEGCHTNTIEGTWSGIKRTTPVAKRTAKSLPGFLFDFIWRRRNEGNLWNGLMAALRDCRY